MKLFLSAIALAFIFTGCNTADRSVTATAPSDRDGSIQAAATVEHDLYTTGNFYNECCDEWVFVEGPGHWVFKDGQSHFNGNSFTGTGASGRTYTQQGSCVQNIHADADGSYLFNLTIRMMSDDGCSFVIHWNVKIAFNANGEMTAEHISYEIDCLDD